MPTPSDAPGASFPDDPGGQEGVVGGADAVPKTTWVVGQGTEPETQRRDDRVSPSPGGTSGGKLIAVVLAILVLGGLVYALAL